jgi:hypothetical protein
MVSTAQMPADRATLARAGRRDRAEKQVGVKAAAHEMRAPCDVPRSVDACELKGFPNGVSKFVMCKSLA